MTMRFTLQDNRELKTFNSIMKSLEGLLPLSFIIEIYLHMKERPTGFDTTWLQRALVTAQEVAEAHDLNTHAKGILLTIVTLMEAGRGFKGASSKEASASFAISFINRVAPKYFEDEEIKIIYNCCRYNSERFKRGVDGAFVIMTDCVRVLTNVRFNDLDSTVIKFVRENKEGESCPVNEVSIDEWHTSLATAFDVAYGHTGTEWRRVSLPASDSFKESILAFKRLAANKVVIKSIISQNYPKIFCR